MAKLLKLRRGTTTQHGSFTGAEGEVTIDTTKDTAVVHDGSQAGGRPLAREDMNNVSSANILGRISNGDIVGTKLENSGVTAGSYGSSSAIPIVTVDAQGLVTAASTTAIDSTTIANGSSSVSVANNGAITSNANHDFSAGIDVTGTVRALGSLTVGSGNDFQITRSSNNTEVQNYSGTLLIGNASSNSNNIFFRARADENSIECIPDGAVKLYHDGGGVKFETSSTGATVTGNLAVTGTVDGRDVAADGALLDGITNSSTIGEIKSTATLANGVVATTQAASDNTTKVATTAYVTTAIGNSAAFPSGTKMLFQQTSAPTGWTKVTSGVDNKALRVVSGTAGSGGSNAFSNTLADRSITANAGNTTATGNISVADGTGGGNVSVTIANASTGGTVNNHTLSTNEMPSHNHGITGGNWGGNTRRAPVNTYGSQYNATTNNTGGGGAHSHGFTGGSHSHNVNASFSGSAHSHNATFSGAAHNHSISVTNLDLAVSYLDVIIASKD